MKPANAALAATRRLCSGARFGLNDHAEGQWVNRSIVPRKIDESMIAATSLPH